MIVGQLSDVRGIVGRDSVIARALCGEISPRYAPDVRISPDNAPGVIFPRAPESRPTTLRTSKARPKACGARQASDNTHMARHIQQKNDPHRIPMRVASSLCARSRCYSAAASASASAAGASVSAGAWAASSSAFLAASAAYLAARLAFSAALASRSAAFLAAASSAAF